MKYKKEATIILGFGAIGKTYLSSKYNNVIDIESTFYKWDNTGLEHLSEEEKKGVLRPQNPDWPQNYINTILKAKKTHDIILCGMQPFLREYLHDNKIEYLLAFPTLESKDSYEVRAKSRGNNNTFVQGMMKNFDKWSKEVESYGCKILWLKPNQFLEDVLIEHGLINKQEEKI